MPHRSFIDLAPPPVVIANGIAVPIDIERISARLKFDPLRGDMLEASVAFTTGPADGYPVFDLRQTIRAAWLDGSPFPSARLSHEDLGGGPDAQMRVMRQVLPANTSHVLRLVCPLGLPQARMNNRRPIVQWDQSRLTFRFGFSDLIPGRYLESWLPANLIYDEFDLSLQIELAQTNVPHVVITTGTVCQTGFCAWNVHFPKATACTPLLEIHAIDRVKKIETTLTLPRSRTALKLEAWKESDDDLNDLDIVLNNLALCMSQYDEQLGPYAHGERFVYIVDASGGMEYAGGATGAVGQIQHELAHSWWGRGVRPANQADGWIDEAIATWVDSSSGRAKLIDTSTMTRVALCHLNLWSRVTPKAAYFQGKSVFAHLSAIVGLERFEAVLREVYIAQVLGPLTTKQLEALLLCELAAQSIVNVFHRYVHGLPDHATKPCLDVAASSDGELDTLWNHSALWVRQIRDGKKAHQTPQFGDNWIYARVRNSGTADVGYAALVVRLHTPYVFDPNGVELPDCAVAVSTVLDWKPSEERLIVIPWKLRFIPTYPFAISLQILAQGREIADSSEPFQGLTWKSYVEEDVFPGNPLSLGICIGNRHQSASQLLRLQLRRPEQFSQIQAALSHPIGLPFSVGSPLENCQKPKTSTNREPVTELLFPLGSSGSIILDMPPASLLQPTLIVHLPDTLPRGEQITLHLVAYRHRDNTAVGGLSILLTVL